MDEKEIDWSSTESIIEAAKPFDRSYSPDRPVMLAGSEVVAFVRHHFNNRKSGGRRISDAQSYERMKELEDEIVLLKAQNELLLHRLMKDRRKQEIAVSVERRYQD